MNRDALLKGMKTIDKNDDTECHLEAHSHIKLFDEELSDAYLTTTFNTLLIKNNIYDGDNTDIDSDEKRAANGIHDAKGEENNRKPGSKGGTEGTSYTTTRITSDIRKVAGVGCDIWGLQRLELAKIVRDYMRNYNNYFSSRRNKDQDKKTSNFILRDFCIENGTLLGAWRSGKFIPHDDDFDMAMFIDLLPTCVGGEKICSTEEGINKLALDSESSAGGILPMAAQEADVTRELRACFVLEQIKAYLDACFEGDGLTEQYATRIISSYGDKIEVFEPKYGDYALVGEFYGDNARFHYVTVDLQPYVRVGDHGVGKKKDCDNLVIYRAPNRANHHPWHALKEDDVMPCADISLEGDVFPAPRSIVAVLTEMYVYLGYDAVYNKQTKKYEKGE